MKIPVYKTDFDNKIFDKIAKLVSKAIEPEKVSLGKARDILSKALGYRDYHDLHKSIISSSCALPASSPSYPDDIKKNVDEALSPDHAKSFNSSIEYFGMTRLAAFAKPKNLELLAPLSKGLENIISEIISHGLYRSIAQQLSASFSQRNLPENFDVFTSSISEFMQKRIPPAYVVKDFVVKEAHDLLCKHDGRGWVASRIWRFSKELNTSEKLLLETFRSDDFRERSISAFESLYDRHSKNPLIDVYIEDHKSRTLRESGADWVSEEWFPSEFKEWNYILADFFGEDYFNDESKSVSATNEIDKNNDCIEGYEEEQFEELYIHQKYDMNDGSFVEIYSSPVEESHGGSIGFHTWVARLIYAGVIICQATGTIYNIDGGCTGGDLIYTSDMRSDTDVHNMEEFLIEVRRDQFGDHDNSPLRSIILEDYGNHLIFFQGLQKNQKVEHYYAGSNFAPLVVEILEESFASEGAFTVLRSLPDTIINQRFMIPAAKARIDEIKEKISSKITTAFEDSEDRCFKIINGGEIRYRQFETIQKLGSLLYS